MKVTAIIAMLFCETVFAACSTNIDGYSADQNYHVVIYQDCGIKSEIVVSTYDKAGHYTVEYQRALLDAECEFLNGESILSCRQNGRTVLSGTKYKLTFDGGPMCPEDKASHRYTCFKGCNKSAPKYLDIQPYEC